MKRRTFISLMSVLAAAGVLTLSGCSSNASSSNSNSSSKSESAEAADQLSAIQASGKLIVALEGAWQPWSYHDESDTLVGYDVEVSRAIAEKLGVTKPSVVRVLNLLMERFTAALALTAALPERVFTGQYDQLMGAEEAPSAAG